MQPKLNLKQCTAAISQIKISGKGLDEAVQSVGLSVLQDEAINREPWLALKLLNALPKGSRRNALVDWFRKYGQIAVNLDKETAKTKPLLFVDGMKTDLEGAAKEPRWKCKPEKALTVEFSAAKLEAEVARMLLKVQDGQAKGSLPKDHPMVLGLLA